MLLLLSTSSQKLSLTGFRIQMPEGCIDNTNIQSKKQQGRLGSKHNQASNNRARGKSKKKSNEQIKALNQMESN